MLEIAIYVEAKARIAFHKRADTETKKSRTLQPVLETIVTSETTLVAVVNLL